MVLILVGGVVLVWPAQGATWRWRAWPLTGMAAGVEGRILSASVRQARVVDGDGRDAGWKAAKPTKAVAKGVFPPMQSTEVVIRSVPTDTQMYVLVRWRGRDAGRPGPEALRLGSRQERLRGGAGARCALAFERTGPVTADMLAPVEAVWDVWHWKASRTNPQGFAMDRTHRYTRQQWEGKGRSHTARDGQPIWIA